MAIDYYEVLGVSADADYELIKRQYRVLVRENHPDVAPDKQLAHARMQLILEAWETLSHHSRRARYDEIRRGGGSPDSKKVITTAQSGQAVTVPDEPTADARETSAKKTAQNAREMPRSGNMRTRMLTMVFEANQLFYAQHQPEEAIFRCKKIVDYDPTTAEAWALLGDIYTSLGKKSDALDSYDRACRHQPQNMLYRQKLNALQQGAGGSNSGMQSTGSTVRGGRLKARPDLSSPVRPQAAGAKKAKAGCGGTVFLLTAGAGIAAELAARLLM